MSPTFARIMMTLIISIVIISATILVNSRYHGSFVIGLFAIVLPLLALSYALPRVLPVRCPRCHHRMRFASRGTNDERHLFAYVCDHCLNRHEWEGASGGSTLGD